MTSRIDLVIFDCDGVLVDSELISARILTEALRAADIRIEFDYLLDNFIGRSFPKVADIIRHRFDRTLPEDFEKAYRASLLAAFEDELQTTDGIHHVLANLDRPYCVATSSSPARVGRSLELVGLSEAFGERVFTASQVLHGKPAPDLFLLAAESLGVPAENCVVIEDSVPGIEAGIAAGMRTYRYTGGGHLKDGKRGLPDHLRSVQTFDNWQNFFEMHPELYKCSSEIR